MLGQKEKSGVLRHFNDDLQYKEDGMYMQLLLFLVWVEIICTYYTDRQIHFVFLSWTNGLGWWWWWTDAYAEVSIEKSENFVLFNNLCGYSSSLAYLFFPLTNKGIWVVWSLNIINNYSMLLHANIKPMHIANLTFFLHYMFLFLCFWWHTPN